MNLDQDDCSNYQMMRMLNLSLVIVQQPAPANMTQVTVSGYVSIFTWPYSYCMHASSLAIR